MHLLALQDFDRQLTALPVAEHDDCEAAAAAFLVGRQSDVLDVGKGHEERADIVGRRLAIQIPDVDLEHAHRDPPGGADQANQPWPVRVRRRLPNAIDTSATERRRQKRKEPPWLSPRGPMKSAMTYFPAEQYHRRQGLNCCVRDGNRCDPLAIVTDKPQTRLSASLER